MQVKFGLFSGIGRAYVKGFQCGEMCEAKVRLLYGESGRREQADHELIKRL